MHDRVRLNRKKTNTSIVSNSLLSSAQSTSVDSSTQTASSCHDLSRIAPRCQAKLSISQPGDAYEQEADKIAQKVMGMDDRSLQQEPTFQSEHNLQRKPVGALITPLVQRAEIPGEEKEETLQMKSVGNFAIQREEVPDEEEELVQAKSSLQRAGDGGLTASNDISSKLHSRRGGGSPLGDNVRSFMEPRFGADFSNVKVHADGEAVQMARDVGAQAFAYGSDVYFGAGKSPGNNELTAHELTHVVQQTGSVMRDEVAVDADAKTKVSVEEDDGKTDIVKQEVTIQVTLPNKPKILKQFSAEVNFSVGAFGLSPIEFSANFKQEFEKLKLKLNMTELAFKVKATTSVDLSPLANPIFGLYSGIEGEYPLFRSKAAIFGGVGASIDNKDGKFSEIAPKATLGLSFQF